MAYEIRNNSGSAFKNKKKQAETHPDYSGEALINELPMWINVWVKKDKNQNTYFSFSFKEKQFKQDTHSEAKSSGYQPEQNFDNEIPF